MLSNALMNFAIKFNSLLTNATTATDTDFSDKVKIPAWLSSFVDIIFDVLVWVGVIVAAAGTIYAIVLGINMARADSAEKREEAKQRIVYTVIGIGVCVVLVLVFVVVSNFLPGWLAGLN